MDPDTVDQADLAKRGSYVLIMRLPDDRVIDVGRLGPISFRKGYYAYAGSAMGGLKSRLQRHLRNEKKLHWHIDYFLHHASIYKVLVNESDTKLECSIAGCVGTGFEVVPKFGSSDCRCPGHLFYSDTEPVDHIKNLLFDAGIPVRVIDTAHGKN